MSNINPPDSSSIVKGCVRVGETVVNVNDRMSLLRPYQRAVLDDMLKAIKKNAYVLSVCPTSHNAPGLVNALEEFRSK